MNKGEKKRREIQNETMKLINEKGYGNVQITEVAKNIGISIGGMYHHYQSMNDIILDILKHKKKNNINDFFDNITNIEEIKSGFINFIKSMKNDLLSSESQIIDITYNYYFGLNEQERYIQLSKKYDETYHFMNICLQHIILDEQLRKNYINDFIIATLGIQVMSLTKRIDKEMVDHTYHSFLEKLNKYYEEVK